MKPGAYFLTLLMGVACVTLCIVLIVVVSANQRMQGRLQTQQQALSSGVLGQQAQQISGNVLQEMANAAATNPEMKALLEKHGLNVRPPETPASAAAAAAANGGRKAEGGRPEPKASDAPSESSDGGQQP